MSVSHHTRSLAEKPLAIWAFRRALFPMAHFADGPRLLYATHVCKLMSAQTIKVLA
jgi:hypothetical protein